MAIYAEKTADRQGIHTIDIATYGIDTELVQTEDEQIKASLQGDGAHAAGVMLAMERKGDVLLIRADKSGRMFNLNLIDLVRRFRLIAVIEVPDVLFNMIRVHSRSGDIRARRLMAEEMVLESTSGDLDIGGCMAKRSLVVHAGSGDVLLSGILAKEKLNVHTGSGDQNLRNLDTDRLDISASSGNLTVSEYAGTLAASTGSGDIDLRSDDMTGDISARAGSGDIAIAFTHAPESFTVNYQGSSGDGVVRIKDVVYEEKSVHRLIGRKGDGRYKIDVLTGSGDFVLE
ncbi:MAG: DUF4097 domain-containing protein [Sporolactobacillus sp.]|jgi:hypothetical protein|nr:DUF4097 domain-containing protein [Sporolactobacillus sp.]